MGYWSKFGGKKGGLEFGNADDLKMGFKLEWIEPSPWQTGSF